MPLTCAVFRQKILYMCIFKGKRGKVAHCCCCWLPSHVQLFCDPMDCSPPGSSAHEIYQAGILEWVAISFSKRSSHPGIEPEPASPVLAGGFFTTEPSEKPQSSL